MAFRLSRDSGTGRSSSCASSRVPVPVWEEIVWACRQAGYLRLGHRCSRDEDAWRADGNSCNSELG